MHQLQSHIWERACRSGYPLDGGTPARRGDRALSAALCADAFVSAGGVLHLFDAAVTRLAEIADGYRYFGFCRLADFVGAVDLRLEGRMLSEVADVDAEEARRVVVRSLPLLGLVVAQGASRAEIGDALDLWYFTAVGPRLPQRFVEHLHQEPSAYAPPNHPCAWGLASA